MQLKNPARYFMLAACICIVFLSACTSTAQPDLSLVNIDNALVSIATSDLVTVNTLEDGTLTFAPNGEFLACFNQGKWKEKKSKPQIESTATLRFVIQEEYYIDLYEDEDIALVYCAYGDKTQRYYALPEGAFEAIKSYVFANGAAELVYFVATVLENNGMTLLVAPIEEAGKNMVSDKCSVSCLNAALLYDGNEFSDFGEILVGSTVEIGFSGAVAESYPTQITATRVNLLTTYLHDGVQGPVSIVAPSPSLN